MKLLYSILLITILAAATISACEQPTASLDKSIVFCTDNYTISNIEVQNNNLIIDCNSSTLRCRNPQDTAITIEEKHNISIINCKFTECNTAINILTTTNLTILNNTFTKVTYPIGIFESEYALFRDNRFNDKGTSIFGSGANINIETNYYEGLLPNITTIQKKQPTTINPINNTNTSPNTQPSEIPSNKSTNINQTKSINQTINQPTTKDTNYTIELDDNEIAAFVTEIVAIAYPQISDRQKEKLAKKIIRDYENNVRGKVFIQRSFAEKENSTTITLTVANDLPKGSDISIYETVPKCAAEFATGIIFTDDEHTIVKDDPLIVWHIVGDNKMSYSINKNIPDWCQRLFEGMPLKDLPKKSYTSTIILIIGLILLIMMILIRIRLTHP